MGWVEAQGYGWVEGLHAWVTARARKGWHHITSRRVCSHQFSSQSHSGRPPQIQVGDQEEQLIMISWNQGVSCVGGRAAVPTTHQNGAEADENVAVMREERTAPQKANCQGRWEAEAPKWVAKGACLQQCIWGKTNRRKEWSSSVAGGKTCASLSCTMCTTPFLNGARRTCKSHTCETDLAWPRRG